MVDLNDNLFMLPGPVKMHPRVLRAMSLPAMAHRSGEFKSVNMELRELLQYTFQTKGEVALISGSGTAGMETAIANLCRKGDKVLNLASGKFGERLHELSKIYADPTLLKFEWGKPIDVEKVVEALEKEQYRAVTFCHNETSTALTNPAKEIAAAVKKSGSFLILDGITSIGGLEVKMDELGADISVFGSQKCLAAPAGLAGVAVSKKVEEALYSDTTYYLNLKKHIKKLQEGDTPWTPAIPLFLAMREALRMLKEEGLENRIKRCAALGDACRSAAKALNLSLFPDEKYASNTLTGINYPANIKDSDFRNMLKDKYNVIIAGAQDHIKGKVFRIGHMGICSWTDMVATWAAIEATLKKMGYPVKPGAAVGCISERM
jgi:aspartate aminotransferase-like enzyme